MRAMTAAVVTQGIQARFLHQSAFRQRHARRSTCQALPAIWKTTDDTERHEPRNREACQSLTACVTVNSSHLIQPMGAPSDGVEGSGNMFAEIIARTVWLQGLLKRKTSLSRVCPSMRAIGSWEDYDRVSEVPGQQQKLIPYATWLRTSS